jgi:hypothetical protein
LVKAHAPEASGDDQPSGGWWPARVSDHWARGLLVTGDPVTPRRAAKKKDWAAYRQRKQQP